jgi:hypothetical protein
MAEGVNIFQGRQTALNISASKVIKAVPGVVGTLVVNTAGTSTAINDCATTGAAAASNLVFSATAVGVYKLNFPCLTGITVIVNGSVSSLTFD